MLFLNIRNDFYVYWAVKWLFIKIKMNFLSERSISRSFRLNEGRFKIL